MWAGLRTDRGGKDVRTHVAHVDRLIAFGARYLKREEGQGATEYALVVAFVVVAYGHAGPLGTGIPTFLGEVAGKIESPRTP